MSNRAPKFRTRFSVVFVLSVLSFFLIINLIVQDPKHQNLNDRLRHQLVTNNWSGAVETFTELLSEEPYNIDRHYQYITFYFSVRNHQQQSDNSWFHHQDEMLVFNYMLLASSSSEEISDIGHYGLGLIAFSRGRNEEAYQHLGQVRDRDLKYLNNTTGRVLVTFDSLSRAQYHFEREIELGGNLSGAYNNLARLFLARGEEDTVFRLLETHEARRYVSDHLVKRYHLRNIELFPYLMIHLRYFFGDLNVWGFIAALLILLVWLAYLYKLDIFEQEKITYIIAVTTLGMVFSLLTGPISDILNLGMNFTMNGNLVNDFLYCWIGIGMIEELVKIIPLFIMLRVTKAINEPYDFLLYASASALGFAFIENLIYFDESRLQIIHGRALSAVVMHMFLSSLIAYGMVLSRYAKKRRFFVNLVRYFLISSLIHGVYDLLLLHHHFSSVLLLPILLYISSLAIWNTMINNALNNSTFFDREKLAQAGSVKYFLIVALTIIFLFEYTVLMIKNGPDTANPGLFSSIARGSFLIALISLKLSNLNLRRGVWMPIRVNQGIGISNDTVADLLIENGEIDLNPFSRNNLAGYYLPASGKVVRRLTLGTESDWFLVRLDHDADIEGYRPNEVLVRVKGENTRVMNQNVVVGLLVVPNNIDLGQPDLSVNDFAFCGWALAKVRE
jgi:protease PrsW